MTRAPTIDRSQIFSNAPAPRDPTEPVSSDEVIEVHKQLSKFEGSIADLLQHPA